LHRRRAAAFVDKLGVEVKSHTRYLAVACLEVDATTSTEEPELLTYLSVPKVYNVSFCSVEI
jgi:hypothetical protein